ncbi:membrane-associated protein [Elusimicrobium simillimum]|uniref:DedA family protein n=1 Tax=Elusimicrobium simillimum TaxID=3143438 RepID=UPI003C6FFCC6
MEILTQAVDVFLHLDVHLNAWAGTLGPWLYVLLFVIVFCETGLVVTPFLPGDSLLFAVGALASIDGSPINLYLVIGLLIVAAIGGDSVNYEIGKHIGPKVFKSESSRWLNKAHLMRAHNFYEKYGGKTIILARFIPIIRTFAPFVAGIGAMTYRKFISYNVIGAIAWVLIFCVGGYIFGDLPVVQNHFHYVIVAIVVISFIPAGVEIIRAKMEKN